MQMNSSCVIRRVAEADLPMILEWRNHPDIRRFMLNQHQIALEEHIEWFRQTTRDMHRQIYIVEDLDRPLGFVQFNRVSAGGVSDWGFYAVPNSSKGTGKKIGITALDHAFRDLKLHKICGQAVESNRASIEFHKRLGFKQEGLLREQQKIGDTYYTMVCFGLLAAEWRPDSI
jgi:UDP-4-amino-4,6-dideoxy-N-acetyl-beta-L-altrosamine N-acetyltransferase